MMSMSWTIGRFFNIPVRLHVSMLILPLLTYGWMPMDGPIGILVWLGLVVLLFGSILLHELGHALTARRYGIHTQDIILTPIGGMARILNMPQTPKQEIAIAIAGPLVSLSISASSFALLLLVPFRLPLVIYSGISLLTYINLMLGLFNLVPALPMDGGRVLRGLLALKYDFLTATEKAAKVGRILAVIGGLVGIFYLQSWSLALISVFIYVSAGTEVRMAAWRQQQSTMGQGSPHSQPDPFGRAGPWRIRVEYPPRGQRGPGSPPNEAHPGSSPHFDWPSQHPPNRDKDVLVVKGGKAEIISRKDPSDRDTD